MARSKTQSSAEESSAESPEVRRRVVRACQRCRLKKCKCDGSSPCTRCKSDDAICAYGRHKKSDKTVFRKGYVQMLERQHVQLIAGLQEMYRLSQLESPVPIPRLDPVNHGQPLTHQLLQALGVLQPDEWDDSDFGGSSSDQFFEPQAQEELSYNVSGTEAQVTGPTTSPLSANKNPFPHSEIMMKRKSKTQESVTPMSQMLSMPPVPTYHLPAYAKSNPYSHPDLSLQIPQSVIPQYQHNGGSGLADSENMDMGSVDWAFNTDDVFDNLGSHGLPLLVR